MTTIKITKAGQEGRINYSVNGEGKVLFTVEHPDEEVVAAVNKHLSTKRVFKIPEGSDDLDDYREDRVRPIAGLGYFELALNTLGAKTGAKVLWETEEGRS